ncbi:monomeric thiosulfate reductase apoprotein [Thermodesulfobium acidiphilum]|uniref:Monomeric thiosulfate reductase apoprotein n=1 Tax=Thermodesulfobium acidiphilum TaxID=1794699 RepID=A0A2R4W2T7_THEAF|nr:molybdopterin-dependent oxidoreductase [Thermodesulfobium acidiphilum]AWB11050.1 monomeric thiosulfate reductase apoprotein [Thermodesulfobium acidiphilum]
MGTKRVYSICAMCTGRCPIVVDVNGNEVEHIWGNPYLLGGYHLCPRGAAGKALLNDTERPQTPLIRDGERGSGKWRSVSWDEALDYVADNLKNIIDKYGAKSVVLSDRGGAITEFEKTFLAAIGSPNYFNHHATCSNSIHNAHLSVAGLARNGITYDYKNCKYLVSFGRNLLESLVTGEAKSVIDMIENGGKLVQIDVRWNYTAAKADRFFLINPGTDYALALALIHVIIKDSLYDADFVKRWTVGFEELSNFVKLYTPEFAENETGIPAAEIVKLAHDVGNAKPSVIFHLGWMTAWYSNDFYLRRAICSLNALLGAYEAKGGLIINKGPEAVGKPLKSLLAQVPKPKDPRFDGCGTKYPHLSEQWGLAQELAHVLLTDEPYPVRAYIVFRHDPLASLPDPDYIRDAFSKLDLLVSIDINYSETGWFSDVILPEDTYLERTDHVIARNGPKPGYILRQAAVQRRFDTRPRWWIFKELANRLGVGQYFPYNSIEELIAWQLEGTGYKLEDFNEKGYIELVDKPIMWDRVDGLKFKTPSGKIEFISKKLEDVGIPSFIPYEKPIELKPGRFRLVTSKCALHTQGRTTLNNRLLNEYVSENHLYIHEDRAVELGIKEGDLLEVENEGEKQYIKAKLTKYIHPDVLFMLHGFGDDVPLRTRSFGKGVSDVRLQKGLVKVAIGGNCPFTECTVSVKKVK